jgi:hypothetical protein
MEGTLKCLSIWFVVATKSQTLDKNFVLAVSPSLAPKPVKSNRRTAIPASVYPSAMWLAVKNIVSAVEEIGKQGLCFGGGIWFT